MADRVAFFLEAVGLYAAAGFLFAVVFLAFGVARVDQAARGSGLGFRLIIVPGVIALWPFLLVRWIARDSKRGAS
jgi:hypothetical protein